MAWFEVFPTTEGVGVKKATHRSLISFKAGCKVNIFHVIRLIALITIQIPQLDKQGCLCLQIIIL